MTNASATVAAYGIRLAGLPSDRWLAVTQVPHWPTLQWHRDPRPGLDTFAVDDDDATLLVGKDVTQEDLVHPLLGRIGAHVALRRGDDAMHAGAIVGASGAWAVIGAKGAGKSTLLAALAHKGLPVVTDDVLVFGQGVAKAGPRCIDLRPDAALFGPGADVRPTDPRRRIALGPIAGEHRLVGLIHLDWCEGTPTVEDLSRAEAITRLVVVQNEKGFPARPESLLDLAVLANVRLCRPRSWDGLDETVALVRAVIGDAAACRNQH